MRIAVLLFFSMCILPAGAQTGGNNNAAPTPAELLRALAEDSANHQLKCTACTWCKLARAYIQQKEWGRALGALSNTLQVNPGFRAAYTDAVEILLEQDRYNEAETLTVQAMQNDASTGWYCKGLIAFKDRNWSDAMEYFQSSANGDPAFGNPYMYLAAIAEKQNNSALEASYYRLTIRADAGYYDAYTSLAEYYVSEGQGDSVLSLYNYGIQHAGDTAIISALHILTALEYYRQMKTAPTQRDKGELEQKVYTELEKGFQLHYKNTGRLLQRFGDWRENQRFRDLLNLYGIKDR